MKTRFTRPALDDLASILDYLAERSPQGRLRVGKRIRSVLGLLRAHPFLGMRTSHPSIRRLVVTPYPYIVFYEVTETHIVIHAVRHAARDPAGMPGSN